MKIKRNNSRTAIRVATLVLGLGLVGAGIVSTIGQVMAAGTYPYPAAMRKRGDGEFTGNFEADYSKGIVFRNPNANIPANKTTTSYVTHGTSQCKNAKNATIRNNNYFCGSNNTKQDIYVTFKNAAIYNNEWLDVREYVWINQKGALYAINLDNAGITSDEGTLPQNTKNFIYRELHFYKAGTTNEVNFKGIIGFSDFDYAEGYSISSQNLHRGYIYVNSSNQTPLVHPDQQTWIMSGNKKNTITDEFNGMYMLWAEVSSSSSKPLTLTYINPKFRRGSKNYTPFNTVTYSLSGSRPSDLKYNTYDVVANKGTLSPTEPTWSDKTNYTFKGWYTDAAMTKKAASSMVVTANQTLYGKMVKNSSSSETKASVTTSITNGVITPGSSDIDAGDNYMVGYACNNGFALNSITVNGEAQSDLVGHANSFTFENISGENTIAVECVASTDPTPGDDDDDDDDIDDGTPSIITSIENGTITDSITDYVDAGERYEIEYSCNEGFHLASILVDNEEVSIADYPTSYTFEGVSKKRTIDVVCTDVNTPNTGALSSSNFGSDSTTGGSINVVAIVISSLISIAGIALVIRFVKYNHAISFKK